jgi:hypothetical protein
MEGDEMSKVLLSGCMALLLAACASQHDHAPLIFGQAHSLGVSVGANPATQTPEINLGFKDLDIAVVPTVGGTGPDGLIQGRATDGFRDAYSTFGQFQTNATATGVSLGKFFATGIAARRLADGFACEISDASEAGCPNTPVNVVR